MAYSEDLRIKALEYVEKCGSTLLAGKVFGVTPRTLSNWIKLKKQGSLAPKPRRRKPSKIEDDKLKAYILEHPDAYLREIAVAFNVTIAGIFYACKRLKITLKKRHLSIRREMKKNGKSFEKN
jgi:transposase